MMMMGMKVIVLAIVIVCVSAYDNGAPHSRLPPVGWSSWVALGPGAEHPIFDFCDTDSVKHAADALASSELGLYEAGYRHFHLDDCWAGGRNSTGYVYPDPTRFPNGMKEVVDYVHSKGLVFGLYTCAGTETCVGGRPGSMDHWTQDAEMYAEWGVDWVKMDFCNTEGKDPKTLYPLMSKALNATGRPINFAMCEWGKENPWEWGFPIAQMWRMHGDHTGTWASTKEVIASSAVIPANFTGKPYGWNNMDMLETLNGVRAAHANGKEGTQTFNESVSEFSMWAISASPMIVTTPIMNCSTAPPKPGSTCSVKLEQQLSHASCDMGKSYGCYNNGSMWTNNGCRGKFTCDGGAVTCSVDGAGVHVCGCGPVECTPWITPDQKTILTNTEVLDVNQDVTPQGRPVKDGDLTVWVRHLSDGSAAVALYNQEDTPASIGASFADFGKGWSASTVAAVRDLWGHSDLGTFTGSIPAQTVAPHSTLMYRVIPKSA